MLFLPVSFITTLKSRTEQACNTVIPPFYNGAQEGSDQSPAKFKSKPVAILSTSPNADMPSSSTTPAFRASTTSSFTAASVMSSISAAVTTNNANSGVRTMASISFKGLSEDQANNYVNQAKAAGDMKLSGGSLVVVSLALAGGVLGIMFLYV